MTTMNEHRTTTNQRFAARRAVLAAAVALLFAAAGAAEARPRALTLVQGDTVAQLFPTQRGGGMSLAQATALAQSRFQCRVVRAETTQMGDRVVHEIRILGDDGRVRTVRIDAQTGSFL
jgi:uncharacterized membrane protein YkoI